jgi:hypothetical protein
MTASRSSCNSSWEVIVLATSVKARNSLARRRQSLSVTTMTHPGKQTHGPLNIVYTLWVERFHRPPIWKDSPNLKPQLLSIHSPPPKTGTTQLSHSILTDFVHWCRFGHGLSSYLGTWLQKEGLSWLLNLVFKDAGSQPNDAHFPNGIEVSRRKDENHTWLFLLNYSDREVQVALPDRGTDLITGMEVSSDLLLGPNGVAIIKPRRRRAGVSGIAQDPALFRCGALCY